MGDKIVLEFTQEEYSMLMFLLNQMRSFEGTTSSHYAERLIIAIEKKSKTIKEGNSFGYE